MFSRRATKLIAKTKERDAIEAAAAAQEREFEEDAHDDEGIEGLVDDPSHVHVSRRPADSDEEEEEEDEEAPRPARRRPIIEIQ